MWSSREYLDVCQALGRRGLFKPFEIGSRIARGFADVGYEEFCLLSGNKLVSLLNGGPGLLDQEHEQFFFLVPNVSELVDALDRREVDIVQLIHKGRRKWELYTKKTTDDDTKVFSHRELEIALAQALLDYVSNS